MHVLSKLLDGPDLRCFPVRSRVSKHLQRDSSQGKATYGWHIARLAHQPGCLHSGAASSGEIPSPMSSLLQLSGRSAFRANCGKIHLNIPAILLRESQAIRRHVC